MGLLEVLDGTAKTEFFDLFLSLTWNSEVRNVTVVFWHQRSDGDPRIHGDRGDWWNTGA